MSKLILFPVYLLQNLFINAIVEPKDGVRCIYGYVTLLLVILF